MNMFCNYQTYKSVDMLLYVLRKYCEHLLMHMCSLMYKKIRQEGEIRHMFVWAEGFTLYKEPLGLD